MPQSSAGSSSRKMKLSICVHGHFLNRRQILKVIDELHQDKISYLWNHGHNSFFPPIPAFARTGKTQTGTEIWEAAAGCFLGEPGMRDSPVPEWGVLGCFPQLFKWGWWAAGRTCSMEWLKQAEVLPGGCLELPLKHPDLPWSQHRGVNWILSISGLGKIGKKLQWELLVLVLQLCASKRPRNPSLSLKKWLCHKPSPITPHSSFHCLTNEDENAWFLIFFPLEWRICDFKTA